MQSTRYIITCYTYWSLVGKGATFQDLSTLSGDDLKSKVDTDFKSTALWTLFLKSCSIFKSNSRCNSAMNSRAPLLNIFFWTSSSFGGEDCKSNTPDIVSNYHWLYWYIILDTLIHKFLLCYIAYNWIVNTYSIHTEEITVCNFKFLLSLSDRRAWSYLYQLPGQLVKRNKITIVLLSFCLRIYLIFTVFNVGKLSESSFIIGVNSLLFLF